MAETLAFFSGIGWHELLIVLIVALLIFGRRLPEVGKSLGKGIVEFKKGLKGIEDDMDGVDRDIDRTASKDPAQLEADAGYDEMAYDGEPSGDHEGAEPQTQPRQTDTTS